MAIIEKIIAIWFYFAFNLVNIFSTLTSFNDWYVVLKPFSLVIVTTQPSKASLSFLVTVPEHAALTSKAFPSFEKSTPKFGR